MSISCRTGEIHGILGANGAGKTTLFQVVYGMLQSPTGSIQFEKEGLSSKSIAYLETETRFYPYMKGREYIDLLSHNHSGFNISRWNEVFQLPLDAFISTYSTGMKKKLALFGVLSLNRPILLLDEPYNGLDIESVEYLNHILPELKRKKKTVVITSHIIDVLKGTCDTISFLNHGRIQQTFKKTEFNKIDKLIKREFTQNIDQVLPTLFKK